MGLARLEKLASRRLGVNGSASRAVRKVIAVLVIAKAILDPLIRQGVCDIVLSCIKRHGYIAWH